MADPKILALIPARGGSKGVPRKNVRPLAGRPLIVHTLETALARRARFHRVVVSTDDPEIAELARASGADVPFLRPAELAADHSPTLPVIRHALHEIEALDGVRLDWVCLLQPTAPLRAPEDLDAALDLAAAGGCDSVISVVRVFAHHPILMKKIEGDRLLPFCLEEREGTRRQDYQPAAYMRNGAIYLSRREALERGSIWGEEIRPLEMPPERSLNIDDPLDFKLAELLLAERDAR